MNPSWLQGHCVDRSPWEFRITDCLGIQEYWLYLETGIEVSKINPWVAVLLYCSLDLFCNFPLWWPNKLSTSLRQGAERIGMASVLWSTFEKPRKVVKLGFIQYKSPSFDLLGLCSISQKHWLDDSKFPLGVWWMHVCMVTCNGLAPQSGCILTAHTVFQE